MVLRHNFGAVSGLAGPALTALMVVALIGTAAGVAPLKAKPPTHDRVVLFPKLVTGQVLTYQIAYHADKTAATKSTIASSTPQAPSGTETNVRALLRLEIVGVERQAQRPTVRARTHFQVLNSATQLTIPRTLPAPPGQTQREGPE